jgi:hypothetical protein
MRPIQPTLVLIAAACARRPPQVAQEDLAAVPPEVMETTAPLRAQVDDLERRIAAAEVDLAEATTVEDRTEQRVAALDDSIESARELKSLAVERGDTAAATDADGRLERLDDAYAEARDQQDLARHRRAVVEAELALMRAEQDLANARIELARADAVAAEGDLRVAPYERAVKRALERRDEAARELDQVRGPVPAGT